jgi:adenylate kinase family enzyme
MTCTNRPCLILVSGPPGAGKSTFSKSIVTEFKCTWLEIDCLGDPFSLGRDQEYIKNIEPQVIQGLLNLAALNLSAQQSVLLDLPWKHLLINNPEWLTQIQNLAIAKNVSLLIFECCLSEPELRRRIIARNAYRDLDKIQSDITWQDFLNQIHFKAINPLPHILINTEEPQEANFAIAKKYLQEALQDIVAYMPKSISGSI